MYNQICEICGNDMIHVVDKSTQGWSCPFCGWNLLTSYNDDIDKDLQIYEVFINPINDMNYDQIKVISKITNKNYITVKKMILNNESILCKQNARGTKKIIDELDKVNIIYEIRPGFQCHVNNPLDTQD